MNNPFDSSEKFEFDLPAVGVDEEEERRERLLGEDQREQALKQKSTGRALTESRAFGILAEYVEGQRQARMNHLLLTPITDKNKDELNFMRGEVAGLMLALRFAKAIAEGAEATLEIFKEEDRINESATNGSVGTKH